jgi:hypothetical protein
MVGKERCNYTTANASSIFLIEEAPKSPVDGLRNFFVVLFRLSHYHKIWEFIHSTGISL